MSTMLRELVIMNDVAKIMEELTNDERRRVVAWLEDYFDIDYGDGEFDTLSPDTLTNDALVVVSDTTGSAMDASELDLGADDEAPLDSFQALYAKVAPKTAIQKIVAAAYWLETKEDKEAWKSFETNKLLKTLDVKVSSVSGTLALEAKKDTPLVELLAKSGDSMQARKTFKLSEAGYAFVEDRIA